MVLNTATSIVDFLKSQNKPSDFNSRQALYESSGLKDAFGDYRGTAEQNSTLLRRIQGTAQPQTQTQAPANPQLPGGTTSAEQVINNTTPSTISSIQDITRNEYDKTQPSIDEEMKALGATELRGATTLGRDVGNLKAGAEANVASLATQGEKAKQKIGETAAGFGGANSGVTQKGQADIATEVAQKQDAVRAKLGNDLYNKFSDFEKNFGTDFLRTLSIPEAESFTNLPLPVRGAVVNSAQKVIEAAYTKAKNNADKMLSDLGYVQLPDGTILQKPSDLRAEQSSQRAEQRLTLAEEAGRRAETSLNLALARFNGEGGGTSTEKADRLYDTVSRDALQEFERTKGTQDNYYNPDVYMAYRNKLEASAPSKIDDFDKTFALRLNPVDAIRLGINQAKYQKQDAFNQAIINLGGSAQ